MRKFALLNFLMAVLPFSGSAHPGHGETGGFTIIHYFVEPQHVLVLIWALAAVVYFYRSYISKKKKA